MHITKLEIIAATWHIILQLASSCQKENCANVFEYIYNAPVSYVLY